MNLALLILGAPLAALGLLGALPPLRRSGRPAAALSIAAVAVSFLAALVLLGQQLAGGGVRQAELLWLPLTAGAIRFGLLVDGLSAPMAVVVALVALLVQVYSLGYMRDEPRAAFGRYYAYHSLFACAMLGLVLAHNVLQTYVCWELVGLGSYLLIGFWHERPAAAAAALKAFWITRLADTAFAIGLVLLWRAGGTLVFSELFAATAAGTLGGAALVAGVAGLYVGAMGKSAQFPFHVWLPDAMEGPTPVSALIHAATMVAAGVYLMLRVAPLLAAAGAVGPTMLAIGVLTALVGACLALVERDVKRILAYSTISQLGLMLAAVGAGASSAALFHLLTHACFKALLFLAAGALIHALHTNDIFAMGGLGRRMPHTALLFLTGGLALAGAWPTSGFFSKDAVLAGVWDAGHPFAFLVLLGVAGLTAFYMARAFFVIFLGREGGARGAHDPPAIMRVPMIVLAVLAWTAGLAGSHLARLLAGSLSAGPAGLPPHEHAPLWIGAAATTVALAGVLVAYLGYQSRTFDPDRVRRALVPLAHALDRRLYVDDLFQIAYRVLYRGTAGLVGGFDRYVVDGLVNVASVATLDLGGRLRRIHTGRAQDALYAVALGFLLLIALALGTR